MKSIFKDAKIGTQAIFGIAALAMVILSIYLTNHYFQVKFPTEIGQGSLCDINSFLNCDAATHSHASNLLGVPISIFGLLVGLFALCGFIFKNEKMEGSVFSLLGLNLVGCLGLFIYSLIVLGSLCPFCTLYYIASGLAFFVVYKNSDMRAPHWLPLIIFAVITLIISALVYQNVNKRTGHNASIAADLIKQYDALPNLGHPSPGSPYSLAKATENFTDAPLQLTVFSDYQCPACRMLSNITHDVAKRYRGKINIQYMFYPLDHNCNPDIQRPMQPLSCQGAYLSVCLGDKFDKVHDDIFANQERLTMDWIRDYARREGVLECISSEETKQKVVSIINQAKPFSINSTPSMLVNGVKIVGVLPANQLYMILDALLERASKSN